MSLRREKADGERTGVKRRRAGERKSPPEKRGEMKIAKEKRKGGAKSRSILIENPHRLRRHPAQDKTLSMIWSNGLQPGDKASRLRRLVLKVTFWSRDLPNSETGLRIRK